jgi:mRNA interferase MazF
MRRGEVWWAELPEPVGRRPVVLLTRDGAYGYRTMATVAPVTTTIRGIPAEVELGPADGVPRRCVVNLDNLQTIDQRRLRGRLAFLGAERLHEIDDAIQFALGLSDRTAKA